LPGVAAEEQRDDVLAEVGRDGELAAVERGVPQPVEAVLRDQLQRDEVPAGAGHDHARLHDLQAGPPGKTACTLDARWNRHTLVTRLRHAPRRAGSGEA